jgi:hypothetical protein
VRKPGRGGGGGGGGGGRSFLAPHWSQDFFYFFFLYQDLINYSDYPLIRCCGLDVCLVWLMLFYVLCVMDDVLFFYFHLSFPFQFIFAKFLFFTALLFFFPLSEKNFSLIFFQAVSWSLCNVVLFHVGVKLPSEYILV